MSRLHVGQLARDVQRPEARPEVKLLLLSLGMAARIKTYGMNINEVYERIRERESGASAESRTRAELHIQKIKELRVKHKAFIKMPHTKACDMVKYCLAIDRNLGINRIHENALGFIFFKYQ